MRPEHAARSSAGGFDSFTLLQQAVHEPGNILRFVDWFASRRGRDGGMVETLLIVLLVLAVVVVLLRIAR